MPLSTLPTWYLLKAGLHDIQMNYTDILTWSAVCPAVFKITIYVAGNIVYMNLAIIKIFRNVQNN